MKKTINTAKSEATIDHSIPNKLNGGPELPLDNTINTNIKPDVKLKTISSNTTRSKKTAPAKTKAKNDASSADDIEAKPTPTAPTTIYQSRTSLRDYTESKPLTCHLCSYRTGSKAALKLHQRAHNKGYCKCKECDYIAVSSTALVIHMRKHTGERPYACNCCPYTATTSGSLKVHVKRHIGDKRFRCTMCDYRGLSSTHLTVHLRTHTGQKPYACELCSFRSSTSSHLRRHIIIHSGTKPYSCTQCSYKTTRPGCLRNHTKIHTGERPYKCTQCTSGFSYNCQLKKHVMKIHEGGAHLLKCAQCDYLATSTNLLNKHMEKHTDKNLMICVHCNFMTSQRRNLIAHMRMHIEPNRETINTKKPSRTIPKPKIVSHTHVQSSTLKVSPSRKSNRSTADYIVAVDA